MTFPPSARVRYSRVPGYVGKVPFERAPRGPRRGVDRQVLLARLRIRLNHQMRTSRAAPAEDSVSVALWLSLVHPQCARTPRQARALLAGTACPPRRLRELCKFLGVSTSDATPPRAAWVLNRFLCQAFTGKKSSARSAKAGALLAKAPVWSEALFAQAAAIMQQKQDPVWIRQAYVAALLLQALDAEVGVVRSQRRVPERKAALVELRMRGSGLQGEALRQHHRDQEEICLQEMEADVRRALNASQHKQVSPAGVSPA